MSAVLALELEFCHRTRVSKTRNASLQSSFKNLTTNEIVRKLILNAKKTPCLSVLSAICFNNLSGDAFAIHQLGRFCFVASR